MLRNVMIVVSFLSMAAMASTLVYGVQAKMAESPQVELKKENCNGCWVIQKDSK